MYTIKMCRYEELPIEVNKDSISNNGNGKEYSSYLLIYYNDKLIACHSDAMEREDAVFCRDMSWVKSSLEEAYKLGLKDADNCKII